MWGDCCLQPANEPVTVHHNQHYFRPSGGCMTRLLRVLVCVCFTAPFAIATFPARARAEGANSRFVLVSHAPDSDSWWNTIKNAIKQAGEDFGVTVDYRNPSSGDLADMARIIEQASARNYDGVLT